MGHHDDPLSELWKLKEQISARFASVHDLVKEADRIARAEPLPPAGANRKMLDHFPRGQSVGDSDPMLDELWKVKEALAHRLHRDAAQPGREETKRKTPARRRPALKKRPKPGVFRIGNGKVGTKPRGNGHNG